MIEHRAHLPLTAWLDVLCAAMPPHGTLLVGAGNGTGPWAQWLQTRGVQPVWAVEGDDMQYQHLVRNLPEVGWTPRRDVVAGHGEAVAFHAASNPSESGLVQPERWNQLWPNLVTRQTITGEAATTLDHLLSDAGVGINWLVLDCLPAGTLLQGGARLLPSLDVALVRVLAADQDFEPAASADAVDGLLRAAGLRRIHVQAERHPSVAHVLYVRDVARQAADLLRVSEQAQERAAELRAFDEQWQREKRELAEGQERALSEAVAHREALEELRAAEESCRKEKAALLQARNQTTKQAEERRAQILALEKRVRDLQAAGVEAQRAEAAYLEMAKAEAQLSLIKELLFQEPKP